jgi:hypothetical protein
VDPRQAAITTGQSFNIAAQLLTADPEYTYTESTPAELAAIAQEVYPIIVEAQDVAAAEASVGNAFPGTQSAPQAPSEPFPQAGNVVQLPTAAAQPVQQPAPIPGGGGDAKTNAAWQEYFQDPSQWWDNRTSKRSAGAADFAHKTRKNSKGFPDGLWLKSRFGDAPQWVLDRLGV